jgi:hypothetical protein
MVVFLIVAGFFALVAGGATWVVVRMQRIEISESNKQLEEYKLDASKKIADADAAGKAAQADAAKAVVETARANERAAALERDAAELRLQNLELESAIAPRLLQQLPAGLPLRQFAGMQVFISAVPEFEARRFAGYVFVMLQMVDWKPQWLQVDANIMDGVEIEFEGGLRYDPNFPGDIMKAETHANQLQENAAQALLEVLKKQKIDAKVMRLPFSRTEKPRRPGVPPDAISIKVGAKPIEYFMDQRFPEYRAKKLEIQKIIEDAEKRFNEPRGPVAPNIDRK